MGAAEQQQFSQYPLRYGDGTLGAAIAQTRDGKDELITPVAFWELDAASGLYLPPGMSSNPRKPRVEATLTGRIYQVVIPRRVYTTTQSVTVPVPDGVGAVIVAARAHAVTGTFGVAEGWRLRTRPTVNPSAFLHAFELVSPVTTSTVRGWHVIGRGVGTESGDETPVATGMFLQRFQIPPPVGLDIFLDIVGGTFGDGEGVEAQVGVAFCW